MKIMWIKRQMEKEFSRLLSRYPVVTITGPRQSGKTFLVRHSCKNYAYADLELPEVRRLARDDPKAFFSTYETPVIIDEIQRVPELLSYIQEMADKSEKNGQYILTASYQLDPTEDMFKSIADKNAMLRLFPLSLAELKAPGSTMSRDTVLTKGFMPCLYQKNATPGTFYSEYFQNYIERDVRQIGTIRDLQQFERFMRILAGRIGRMINISALADDVGIARETLNQWLNILEASFIIFRLPPWRENAGKRAVKTPKLYFTEPGLATWLLDIESTNQISRDPLMGNIFENMVVAEIIKARLNKGKKPDCYFYRDTRGNGVDLVISEKNYLRPVEIKAGMTYFPEMKKGLKHFKRRFPGSLPGAIVYAGDIEANADIELLNFQHASQLVDG